MLAGEPIVIYGDGEQTRDYVFVEDVVRANLLLSEAPIAPGTSPDERAFNVGTGVGTSVNTLADVLIDHSAAGSGWLVHSPERPGELRHSCLSNARMRGLGWEPRCTLQQGLANTYDYIKAKERKG